MGRKAFVIRGGHAATIANDVDDFRHRGSTVILPVAAQTSVRTAGRLELQFMVEDGLVEFMIGGASAVVLPGDFVRVAPGAVYACRNIGDGVAHLLMRSAGPGPVHRALQLIADRAA